jgi:hypothetical protein
LFENTKSKSKIPSFAIQPCLSEKYLLLAFARRLGWIGTPGQRTEQMYQLADIFASIFEALPEEYEQAIASTPEAA